MKSKNLLLAALSAVASMAGTKPQTNTAELRSIDFGAAGVEVTDDGTIRNCAVMTVGPTLGHPFAIDATTIQQAMALINANPDGVKVRFKHPGKTPEGNVADDAGSVVGRLMPTTRIVGETLRGDVQIGDYAANLPGQGDARSYLMGIAKQDPQAIGLSVVMIWTPEMSDGQIVARVSDVWACDFVGKPAANPNGLLSAQTNNPPVADAAGNSQPGSAQLQPRKVDPMDPKLRAKLVAMGMNPSATDEQAKAFHGALSADMQAKCAAMDDGGDGDMAAVEPDDDDIDPSEVDGADGDKKAATAAKLKARITTRMTGVNGRLASLKAGSRAAAAVIARKQKLELKLAALDGKISALSSEGDVLADETKRVAELTQLGKILGVAEPVVKEQIANGSTAKIARAAFLAALTVAAPAIQGAQGSITVGKDAQQMAMLQAVPEAIALRADHAKIDKPHELAAKLKGLSIIDIGRQWLSCLGMGDVSMISRPRMAEILLSRRELRRENPQVAMLAESVGDFPSILLDAINKTFRPLYLDAPKTWPTWVRKAQTADFKNINRSALSESPSLVKRDAGGQINYVNLSDGKETYALAEYVGGIKITRKAIINDDLDAFGRIPQLQSNACWRAEEEACYGILTANAALGVDSVALFHATHKNLVATTAALGAPAVTSVAAAETLLITQKGPKGAARLGLQPKFLITPAALKTTTQQFLTSSNLIAVISTASSAPQTVGQNNPYSGKLTHVWSPVLDDTSAAVWYLAADYRSGQCDTIEISFLDGEPEPVLRQETDFDSEDVKFAVRHTLQAKAIDFRGLVKNPGA